MINISEVYMAHFQNPEPKYYTTIPNILSHLTYKTKDKKTGKTVIKKLSIHSRELYRILKETAGQHGKCWRNRDNLADLCNMSAGMITKCKQELCQAFEELDGKPLIIITEKKKTKKDQGGTTYHEIMITDIWAYNNGFMAVLPLRKDEPIVYEENENSSPSCGDIEEGSPSCGDIEQEGSPSCGDTNKNPNNKKPLFSNKQCSDKSDSAFFKGLRNSVSEKKAYAYEWMIKNGCKPGNALKLIEKFSAEDIGKAADYLNEMVKKKKMKGESIKDMNLWGYFTTILKKSYWEKKK